MRFAEPSAAVTERTAEVTRHLLATGRRRSVFTRLPTDELADEWSLHVIDFDLRRRAHVYAIGFTRRYRYLTAKVMADDIDRMLRGLEWRP